VIKAAYQVSKIMTPEQRFQAILAQSKQHNEEKS